MKTTATLAIAIALSTLTTFSLSAQTKTNLITNTGKSASYDLKAKDSLVITEGTFSGSINSFETGAKITVAKSASFEPSVFNNPKGTLTIYGAAKLNDVNTNKGFRLDNYGVTTISGSVNMNGGEQYFYNYFNATLSIKGDVNMNSDAFLQNEGTINSLSNFTMNSSSSLINKNNIAVSGTMTVNSASLNNQGKMSAAGPMIFNGSSTITNVCRMMTDGNLINNSNGVYNSGLLWISSKNNGNTLTNSGTITSLSNATIKAVNLTNYGTISGAAKIYTTGTTLNTGTWGVKSKTTDSIKVYDASRTSNKTIFDQQYGTVNNNVVFATLAAPDTINAQNTCSSVYMSLSSGSTLLPIKWNYFTAQLINGTPVINWSADHDPGTIYEVQRSFNNNDFVSIATIHAKDNEVIFQVTDKEADKTKTIIYYRIKGIEPTGQQKFTEIKTIRLNSAIASGIQLSPNPFTSQFTIALKADKKETITIKIYNANGQLQLTLSQNASAGSNSFTVAGMASFSSGIYIVQISNGGEIIGSQKLIKQ